MERNGFRLSQNNRSVETLVILVCALLVGPVFSYGQTEQPHSRIPQTEVPGRRIELKTLQGAVLYTGTGFNAKDRVPLIVHFHGAPWLVQYQIAEQCPRAALITVQLGAGSSVYGRPFEKTDAFERLIDEARRELALSRAWASITLTGFSAGYGAIRALLRNDKSFSRVDNVLLLDGIHASYTPEGVVLSNGGVIRAADLDSFVEFGREAVAGKKSFVISHSAIFPAAYASTTECTNFLIETLGLRRRMSSLETRTGMQQRSVVDVKGFHVRGYSGSTAPDHVDHLHSMTEWLRLLSI